MTRHSVLWLALATHVFAFACAPGLHFWQIQSGTGGGLAGTGDCHGCHATCSAATALAGNSQQPAEPARSPERHDPGRCAICKFFLHAKSLPLAVHFALASQLCEELAAPETDRIFPQTPRVYLIRGPPLA